MSIDAVVVDVKKKKNGTVDLILEPHDSRRAPAGQSKLTVVNPKGDLSGMIGVHIWGGDSSIMVKDKKIADRIGYTKIRLV
jgi:hypothetical protein